MKPKIVLLLMAMASAVMGNPPEYSEAWYVARARAVLANPGRWAPEHVARAQEILRIYNQRQAQQQRAAEIAMEERERSMREFRERERDRRIDELEQQAMERQPGTQWWNGR